MLLQKAILFAKLSLDFVAFIAFACHKSSGLACMFLGFAVADLGALMLL